MNFGQLLRVMRTAARKGLRELARDVGVSPSYLSLVENGKATPPSSQRIADIARALGLSPDVFLSAGGHLYPEVLALLHRHPQASSLLRAVLQAGLTGPEIGVLARALAHEGRGLIQHLVARSQPSDDLVEPGMGRLRELVDAMLLFPHVGWSTQETLFAALTGALRGRYPLLDPEAVVAALLRRESQASTALGEGVALPHARIEGIDTPIVMLASSRRGISYPAQPDVTVNLVFLLLSPTQHRGHLQLLAEIAELCCRERVLADLQRASSKAALRQVLRQCLLSEAQPAGRQS